MSRTPRTILACCLLTACERDPTFFGYWAIPQIERDTVVQSDAGFFEILDNGDFALFLRYRWEGGQFVPEAHPSVLIGSTSQTTVDFGEGYHEKGETYVLWLSLFGEMPFDVIEYTGDRATLSSEQAAWPVEDLRTGVSASGDLQPTTIELQR